MPVTSTQTKSDVADRSARVRLIPEDTRAPRRVRRDVHELPLTRKDTRDPHPAPEVVSVHRRAPNVTSVPRLVRERIRDHLAAKDVSLEAHTAADMRCISISFEYMIKATRFHFISHKAA